MPRPRDYDFPVRELREKLDLTQEELARELGVTMMVVSRWERGLSKPSRRSFQKLQSLERRTKKRPPE
jgi:transcriptional regulator with XRE-family HTH domain